MFGGDKQNIMRSLPCNAQVGQVERLSFNPAIGRNYEQQSELQRMNI